MTRLPMTPSQTVGPYLHIALAWDDGPYAVPPDQPGGFWIRGHVYDGNGHPVTDALVETWQAQPDGGFEHPDDPRGVGESSGFRGFGRCPTGADGDWAILTVKPGVVPAGSGLAQAPHLDVSVFARGLLDRVVTRIYFADELDGNQADAVLCALPEQRRTTLIAEPTSDGYRFDIRLQGEHETVFFAV
jgi:protocatechuate 3,4-dioxygenase alpha subunit